MSGKGFMESADYLLPMSFMSALLVAFVVWVGQRLLQLDGRTFLSNSLVGVVTITPFAFVTAARSGPLADLLKDHGLQTVSMALCLTAAVVIAVGQQAWSRELDVLKLAQRIMGNWILAYASLVAYFVVWFIVWMAGGLVMLGSCC